MRYSMSLHASVAIGLLSALSHGTLYGAGETAVDREIAVLMKRLRSEPLRELVKQKATELANENSSTVQEKAVEFFYDLRAKEVLFSLLTHKDAIIQHAAYSWYLDIFTVEDLPRLYRVAASELPDPNLGRFGSDSLGVYRTRIGQINRHAAKLLRVKQPHQSDWTHESLRQTWLRMLMQAKQKEAKDSVFDEIARQIGK